MNNKWIYMEYKKPPVNILIEAKIRHCNLDLNLNDRIVKGKFKCDNFYFLDGGELSWNWDILEWRICN